MEPRRRAEKAERVMTIGDLGKGGQEERRVGLFCSIEGGKVALLDVSFHRNAMQLVVFAVRYWIMIVRSSAYYYLLVASFPPLNI